jgi:hydrogenase maturation protease
VHLLCDALPAPRGRAGLSDLLVIGLGNAWRGDDAAGLAVARALGDDPRVRLHEGEPIDVVELWAGAGEVILVDAVASGAPAGTVHRLEPLTEPLPPAFAAPSTHAFGLAETLELARALDRLPPRLAVYGIEGERFDAGEALSPVVQASVHSVAQELRARLEP